MHLKRLERGPLQSCGSDSRTYIGFQRRAGAVTFHASLDAAVLPCGMLPYLSSLLGSFQQLCI